MTEVLNFSSQNEQSISPFLQTGDNFDGTMATIAPTTSPRGRGSLEGGMGCESQYAWVVLCKNHKFHKRQNLFFGHRIPLGETDAILPPPALDSRIHIRCDECGAEYAYRPQDLLRIELELPASFTPHPFFL